MFLHQAGDFHRCEKSCATKKPKHKQRDLTPKGKNAFPKKIKKIVKHFKDVSGKDERGEGRSFLILSSSLQSDQLHKHEVIDGHCGVAVALVSRRKPRLPSRQNTRP